MLKSGMIGCAEKRSNLRVWGILGTRQWESHTCALGKAASKQRRKAEVSL